MFSLPREGFTIIVYDLSICVSVGLALERQQIWSDISLLGALQGLSSADFNFELNQPPAARLLLDRGLS